MAAVSLYYLSFLFATTITAFQFTCFNRNNSECSINNLHPEYEGTFVLQHVPKHAKVLTLSQLFVTTVDHTIFDQLVPSIKYLVVNDSVRVRNMIVPSISYIEQLFIINTRLSAIRFEDNDILYLLSIDKARLNHIPSTLANVRNLSYVKINHTPLQQLDLSFVCNLRHLQIIDLRHNRIYFITGKQYADCGSSLGELWLANNRLRRINPTVFVQFSKLEAVTLSNNLIESIAGSFRSASVSELGFSYNLLTKLDLCDWSPMPCITALYLQQNKLNRVPKCLEKMRNLRMINLENNQLVNVSIDVFRELKLLKHVRLSGNPIVSFAMHQHSLPPSLNIVDISHVRLQHLNISQHFPKGVVLRT